MKLLKPKLLLLLIVILFGFFSCLPDLPDDYEELNKPSGMKEMTLDCEGTLVDNYIVIDREINGFTSFSVDTVTINYNYDSGPHIVAENFENNIRMSFYLEDDILINSGRFEYSLAKIYDYNDEVRIADVRIEIEETDDSNQSFWSWGDDFIYVDISEESIIISFCEIPFYEGDSESVSFKTSGRIEKLL